MRKPLITSLATCLITTGLTGCFEKSAEQKTADELEALLAQMEQLDYAAAPLEANSRTYANGTVVDGVILDGRYKYDALYIDQALALLPKAKQIASTGNDRQKQSANTLVASILTDEGAFLINAADRVFQSGSARIASLRDKSDLINEIIAHNTALAGDRAEIIDTIQTGEIGNGDKIDGLNDLKEQVNAADKAALAARKKLEDTLAEVARLEKRSAEYEAIELKLNSEARAATGPVMFEKLDKAVTAIKEVETAEATAQNLGAEAEITKDTAELQEAKRSATSDVIKELDNKVRQIMDERREVTDKLAQLRQDRSDALAALTDSYNEMDALMEVGGFQRMALAVEKLDEAGQAFADARLGPGSDLRQMSIYTLHARGLHQQALAAKSYAAMLSTIAASGPDVLGSELHTAIIDRISEMQALGTAVAKAATELDQTTSSTVSAVQSAVDNETKQGLIAKTQVELYRTLTGVAKSSASTSAE